MPQSRATRNDIKARSNFAIDGVLLLDKASGVSSNHALQQVRHLYGAAKAGHTGTLDPLCSGLLPICFGEATKFSAFHLSADKRYAATLKLGLTTTTGDAEGEVLSQRVAVTDRPAIEAALRAQLGPREQIPPMHSALKHAGKPLYHYARAGIDLPRAPRAIEIYAIELDSLHDDLLSIEVHCSKGTYIRVLAEEIGGALGCGAHLIALRRLASGDLSLEQAHDYETLSALEPAQRLAKLLPIDRLLNALPACELSADDASRFCQGQARACALHDHAQIRVYGPGHQLLGVASIADQVLRPTRVLQQKPAEIRENHCK